MNEYVGIRTVLGFAEVRKNGSLLSPMPSLRKARHSPLGFDWGYAGSGPAQLALALLLAEGLPTERYQEFKSRVVAKLPPFKWRLTSREIRAAMDEINSNISTE